MLTHVHEGVTSERAREATGWDLKVAGELRTTDPPSEDELRELRELIAAT